MWNMTVKAPSSLGFLLAMALLAMCWGASCRKEAPSHRPGASTTRPAGASTRPIVRIVVPESSHPALNSAGSPSRPVSTSVAATRSAPAAPVTASPPSPATLLPATRESQPWREQLAAGDRALAREDFRTAVEAFRRAVEAAPEDLDALQGLAVALAAASQYEQALPVYEKIIDLAAKAAASQPATRSTTAEAITPSALAARTARFNLAVAQMRLDRLGQAQENLEKLLDQDETDIRARYNLATVLQARGRGTEARDQWRKVIAGGQALGVHDRALAHMALGEVLMDTGDGKGALAAYAEATKLEPGNVTAWLDFSAVARATGSLGRALLAGRKAVELVPQNANAHARLAEVLLELHRSTKDRNFADEAVAELRRSLELDPNQPRVSQLLKIYEPIAASRPAKD